MKVGDVVESRDRNSDGPFFKGTIVGIFTLLQEDLVQELNSGFVVDIGPYEAVGIREHSGRPIAIRRTLNCFPNDIRVVEK